MTTLKYEIFAETVRELVLTCKDKLVDYYSKFGIANEGITDKSEHGREWNHMRLTF